MCKKRHNKTYVKLKDSSLPTMVILMWKTGIQATWDERIYAESLSTSRPYRKTVDVKGCTLRDGENLVDVKGVVNKVYFDENCLQYNKNDQGDGDVIDSRNHLIRRLGDPQQATDAAN